MSDIAALLLAMLVQLAMCLWLGRRLSQLAGSGPLFEVALPAGYAISSLIGYVALVTTRSAAAILPAVAVAGLILEVVVRRSTRDPNGWAVLEEYAKFRRSAQGMICVALVIAAAIGAMTYRFWALVEWRDATTVSIGTNIFDDLRTIGFPLSIAAHGFPLRSPQAVELMLAYPLGAFLLTSGAIALAPAMTLAIVLADGFIGSVIYGCIVLVAAGMFIERNRPRVLVVLSALISVGLNLWLLKPDPKTPLFDWLFGYYKSNNFYTTLAWTPHSFLVWNLNHALGFCAVVLTGVMIAAWRRAGGRLKPAQWWWSAAMVAFAAATSADMTVMGCVFAAAVISIRFAQSYRITGKGEIDWQVTGLIMVATVVFAAVNAPSLLGYVDWPRDTNFPLMDQPGHNVGVFASTVGPYVVLIAMGAILLGRRRRAWMSHWFTAACVLVAFSFVFAYHSIWFWRASFALHLVFAMVCARQARAMDGRARGVYLGVWAILLAPGGYQVFSDIRQGYEARDRKPQAGAEAVHWIYRNTSLRDRVSAYVDPEASISPDVDYLRTGNRSGDVTYDRSQPLVGYTAYDRRMRDLRNGIRENDYILYWKDRPEFAGILDSCGAAVAFENEAARIYQVNDRCRFLLSAQGTDAAVATFRIAVAQARIKRNLAGAESVSIEQLRSRVEQLRNRNRTAEAALLLEAFLERFPNAGEARYQLGFTYQLLHRHQEAIVQYDRALAAGFDEFWVRYNRGAAYGATGDRAKGRADLLRARELNPQHPGVGVVLEQLSR